MVNYVSYSVHLYLYTKSPMILIMGLTNRFSTIYVIHYRANYIITLSLTWPLKLMGDHTKSCHRFKNCLRRRAPSFVRMSALCPVPKMIVSCPWILPMEGLEANLDLQSEDDPIDEGRRYQHIVGSMQYLTFACPDIFFNVNKLSQFMESPRPIH